MPCSLYTDEALYVGRTRKLRRRLYTNHLQDPKSTARLKKYIVEDNQNFPEINDYKKARALPKDNFYFQYVEVQWVNNQSKKPSFMYERIF